MKSKCHFIQNMSTGEAYLRCELMVVRSYPFHPTEEIVFKYFDVMTVDDTDFQPNGRLDKLEYHKLWKKKYSFHTPDIKFDSEEILKPYVEWISESISGKWSFRLMYKRQSFVQGDRMWLEFYFENKIDYGHFALRWL